MSIIEIKIYLVYNKFNYEKKELRNMKIKNIFKILVIFLILLYLSAVVVNAEDYGSVDQFDSYTSEGTSFQIIDNTINRTGGIILTIVRIFSFCLGLLLLIIIGIKYMIAIPEVKAELKKSMPTYIIGVVILFAASGILQLVTYFVGDAL